MDNINEKHVKKFGVEPIIIGMRWRDPELIKELIAKAIDNNTPYNEYKELTKEEQKAFDNGSLLFWKKNSWYMLNYCV